MATVTYDGVQAQEEGSGGSIFSGTSFWVGHRVPQRSRYLDMIRSNGGVIVPLEKNADLLIADGARPKDAPPGSVSFKFIEESIKNGFIQVKDRYTIGRNPESPRPVGSGAQTRVGRTSYTTQDDAILAKWVLSTPSANRLGNKLYQELEAVNKRHTWQSWRNRWNKFLSRKSDAELEKLATLAPEDLQTYDTGVAQTTRPVHTASDEDSRAERAATPQTTSNGGGNTNGRPQTKSPRPLKSPKAKPTSTTTRQAEPTETEEPSATRRPQRSAASPQLVDPDPTTEDTELGDDVIERFYHDLEDYMQIIKKQIDLRPTVEGKVVDLWDLARHVEEQQEHGDKISWGVVAQRLGLDPSRRRVLKALETIWEDDLKHFIETMNELAEEYEDEEAEEGAEKDDEQDLELGEEPTNAEAVGASTITQPGPQSPQSADSRGSKRGLDEPESRRSSTRKRRRPNPVTEIPSTPPEELESRSSRLSKDKSVSPSSRRQSRLLGQAIASPKTPRGRPTLETQRTVWDTTPSQQLDIEFQDAITPSRHTEQVVSRRDRDTSPDEPTPRPQQQGKQAQQPPQTAKPSKRKSLPSTFGTPQAVQSTPPQPRIPTVPSNTGEDALDDDNTTDPTPAVVSSPSTRPTPAKSPQTVEEWIEHYQALGYPHPIVVDALRRTTMVPGGLAAHVMEAMHNGNGVPQNYEGVWTDRDDKSLRLIINAGWLTLGLDREPGSAAETMSLMAANKERRRLDKKHGHDRMALRAEFFKALDEIPESSS